MFCFQGFPFLHCMMTKVNRGTNVLWATGHFSNTGTVKSTNQIKFVSFPIYWDRIVAQFRYINWIKINLQFYLLPLPPIRLSKCHKFYTAMISGEK